MLKLFIFLICFYSVHGYFTLPGECPENVAVQEDFKLADFLGKWYQSYHYSSDGQNLNNCSVLEFVTKPSGIFMNQSRVDRGLFHRYSIAMLDIPTRLEDAAKLGVNYLFRTAPRRLRLRSYPFHVLSTNYNYYATVYTCQYSPLINKHYMYIWLLSRHPILNDVSKELALKPLQQFGMDASRLVKDSTDKCTAKYYEDKATEPMTFRYPVAI